MNDNEPIIWVKVGVIARACRPGWPNRSPSREEIQQWLNLAISMKIRSIICLLSRAEIEQMYKKRGADLVQIYRKCGFSVNHIPVIDYAFRPLSNSQIKRVITAFSRLPRPLLIHCSAGQIRTGVALRMFSKFGKKSLPSRHIGTKVKSPR